MISFTIPIETKTTLNSRSHWAVKAKAVAAERRAVAYRVPPALKALGPFLVVKLTRIAPRELDSDNLQGALKATRDSVASALKVDDRTSLVRWEYGQLRGPASVHVSVEVVASAEGVQL